MRATRASDALSRQARELTGAPGDYDALLQVIGDASFVLLGEASHGTHEFYRERALITQRLIEEKGFAAVAVEADWPDAYRVNRHVRGLGEDRSSDAALGGFKRFPTWMWRNTAVCEFIDWLRAYNESSPGREAGFYGLDLYSLHASIEAVLAYLDRTDPEAAARARRRYACFEDFGEDVQAYGYAASFGMSSTCETEVIKQLLEMRRLAAQHGGSGDEAADEFFFAEQNARLVKNAEEYYRTMFQGHIASWNLRDRHMAETLEALVAHLARRNPQAGGGARGPKVVVWAHNSHLGDARATQMSRRGELNLGQLVRERHGGEAVLIGFSTYEGTVTAASNWDGPAERKRVRPALPESYESLFHGVGVPRFYLPLRDSDVAARLAKPRLERAIGVIYRPQTERASHYFEAQLPRQFDALLHFDATSAVEPLERVAPWTSGEPAETYPSGM